MKNRIAILILSLFIFSGFTPGEKPISNKTKKVLNESSGINWIDFATAEKLSSNNDKKYFIYVYTDWCGWCKRMKSTTFQDEEVINLLNDKFNAVMFNAESKGPISFLGREYKFIPNRSRGHHELAAVLLKNKLSYPSIVFLDEKMNMIQPIPGFQSADDLSPILRYLGDKIYEDMTFDDYLENLEK